MPDPCETCPRWYECNGVDRENCPLWKEDDAYAQALGKQFGVQGPYSICGDETDFGGGAAGK